MANKKLSMLVGGSGYVLFAEDPEPAAVGTQKEFPKVSLKQVDGKEKVEISGEGVKLVAFVSEECHSCHDAMDALITSPVLKQDQFDIYYVWQEKPGKVPASAQHEQIHNLILDEKKLSNEAFGWSMTPRFYMLDGENNVIWDELGFSKSVQATIERKAEEV